MGPREGRFSFRSNMEFAVDAPSTVNVKLSLHTAWRLLEVSAGVGELILNLKVEWRGVVSFTLRPPYLRGNSPRFHMKWRIVRPQSQSDGVWNWNITVSLPGIEPMIIMIVLYIYIYIYPAKRCRLRLHKIWSLHCNDDQYRGIPTYGVFCRFRGQYCLHLQGGIPLVAPCTLVGKYKCCRGCCSLQVHIMRGQIVS